MSNYPRTIKPAPESTDPLVQELFVLMDTLGVSAQQLSEKTMGAVPEDTILQWRTRSTPTISNLRLCFEAMGYDLIAMPQE